MLIAERLRQLLSYNPETGEWRWINAPLHNTRYNGQIAGNVRRDGYRLIRISGTAYYSGRLAWLYMTGSWPTEEIDHVDRNPRNDCWSNLREATSSQNKYNRSINHEGYRGVYPCGEKWQVQVGGIYLGIFDDVGIAIAVRDSAAVRLAGDFAILNTETSQ